MSLRSGDRLGPYEVVSPLGAGGMGEVYRATDTRLGRDVALKVLRHVESTSTPSPLVRFQTEARAVAALNHPHILALFDTGQEGHTPYAVFELLEGETLADRLKRGPIAPRKAVQLGAQLCQGLAAAHDRHIIHRDLKPSNVFLTHDGTVKILDFGLARLVRGPASAEGEPVTETRPDLIVGTLGYLSPEQARGKKADARSDVFAVGAILYEMLSGRRAFRGQSTAELLASVLKDDPPEFRSVSAAVPESLDRVVRRCLEKESADRFQTARDVAFALEAVSGSAADAPTAPLDPGRTSRPSVSRSLRHGVLALGAVAGLLAMGAWLGRRSPPPLPTFTQLTFGEGAVWGGRFVPDGRTVVYSASWDTSGPELFTTRVESPESRSLDLPSGGIQSVSSTGDLALLFNEAQSRGWPRQGTLARVPLSGAAPRPILEDVVAADWAPDGTLCVMRRVGSDYQVEWPLGTVLASSFEPTGNRTLRVSPRGDRVAFEAWSGHAVDLLSVDRAGHRTTLVEGIWETEGFAWAPGGREVWFSGYHPRTFNSVLRAVDLSGRIRSIYSGRAFYLHDISADGRLLLSTGLGGVRTRYHPPNGEERDISLFQNTYAAALSRNGQWLLTREGVSATRLRGFYLWSTGESTPVKVRGGQAKDGYPLDVSADGSETLFRAPGTPRTIVRVPTGAGETPALPVAPVDPEWAWWSDDETHLLISGRTATDDEKDRLFVKGPGDASPRPLTPPGVGLGVLSPTGALVAAPEGPGLTLYPVTVGEPRTVPGYSGGGVPLAWSSDEEWVFLRDRPESLPAPARVLRVNVQTGTIEPWRDLGPSDAPGLGWVRCRLATDGVAWACHYLTVRNNLYVVDGLE